MGWRTSQRRSSSTRRRQSENFYLAPDRLLTLSICSRWSKYIGKLVFEAGHSKGGHFAAFERPDALAEDMRKMCGKGGGPFGVVRGKNGYARDAIPT